MPPALERLIGSLLRRVRAGDRHLAWFREELREAPETMRLSSPAFGAGETMPARCAGAGVGQNLSPPLAWSSLPPGTEQLVLLLEDPDAPLPRPVVHLIALIPAGLAGVAEGALTPAAGGGLRFGRGGFGRVGYAGPRPPRGHGRHRYIFSLFALDRALPAGEPPKLEALLRDMAGHVLARAWLVGMFERP